MAARDLAPDTGFAALRVAVGKAALTEQRVRQIVNEELMRGAQAAQRAKAGPELYCSFCGKSQHEVVALIAGPTVFICDECVDLCGQIVAEKRAAVATASPESAKPKAPDDPK